MNRVISLVSASLLAAGLSAQCFETNFGTSLGGGDDIAYPGGTSTATTALPMNINFPMVGGTFANYTHITVNTNGCAFLWNAATGVVGATNTGYSTSAATQLTNIRGALGGAARIAPLWRDLNMQAVNNGAVWLNNSIPGKCVVTWANAVQFSSTSPIFTLQAQLFDSGEVRFYYSGTAASSSATIAGVSPGNAVVAVTGVDLCPGPNSGGTSNLMFQQFTGGTLDLAGNGVSFVPNMSGGFDETCGACTPAFHAAYGAGCYQIATYQAIYQNFPDAATSSAALAGTSLTFTPTANGYTVSNGGGTYIVPSPMATVYTLGDDDDTPVVGQSMPFPHVGGPVPTLQIHSNAFVSMGPGNSNSAYGSVPLLLNSPVASFRANFDLNPAIGGAVKSEEVGTVLYITWEDVPRFGFPGAPERLQMQFDLSSGVVIYVWDLLTTGPAIGDTVVGYAPGPSLDPGLTILATELPITTEPDSFIPAMSLSASPTPVSTGAMGTMVVYTTSNIPEAGPMTGLYVSATILSLGQDLMGTDLGPDAPGCRQYITSPDVFLPVMFAGPTDVSTFSIPAGVGAGFEFYAQSVALVIPNSLPNGQNPGGLTTSNGVRSVINNF